MVDLLKVYSDQRIFSTQRHRVMEKKIKFKRKRMMNKDIYPEMIKNLPEIEIALDGVRGWLMQDDTISAVFLNSIPSEKYPITLIVHSGEWY